MVLRGAVHLRGVAATRLRRDGQLRELGLSDGSRLRSRAVVLATGVSYRQIHNPELDRFHGAGVFYGAAISEASAITGQDVAVVGGGNSAGQAASFLAAHARRVTLLVRGGSLADNMSDYLIRTLRQTPNIDIRYHAELIGASGGAAPAAADDPRHLDRGTGSPTRRRGLHHDRRRTTHRLAARRNPARSLGIPHHGRGHS